MLDLLRSSAFLALTGSIALTAGCAGASATEDQLGRRAAFDMACAENQLQIVPIDAQTRGVRGCGKQATYVEMCDGPVGNWARSCTWVLNTDPGRK